LAVAESLVSREKSRRTYIDRKIHDHKRQGATKAKGDKKWAQLQHTNESRGRDRYLINLVEGMRSVLLACEFSLCTM
jgi:hypothetical protein